MNAIRHYVWRDGVRHGRVAVGVVRNGGFRFVQIAGAAPTPEVLWRVLQDMPELMETAEAVRQENPHPNRVGVQLRHGMSGCTDILLREERDIELCDYPVVARLHVSMAGKLNQDIKFWLGYLPSMLDGLRKVYPPQEDSGIVVEEAQLFKALEIFDEPYELETGADTDFVSVETVTRLRRLVFEEDDDDCPGA